MVPTLVAHTMLGAHLEYARNYIAYSDKEVNPYQNYCDWLQESFKKCVVMVSRKEFDRIALIPNTYLGHEKKTLEGLNSCAIPLPVPNDELPKVLKFAKLWKPRSILS